MAQNIPVIKHDKSRTARRLAYLTFLRDGSCIHLPPGCFFFTVIVPFLSPVVDQSVYEIYDFADCFEVPDLCMVMNHRRRGLIPSMTTREQASLFIAVLDPTADPPALRIAA